MRAIIFDQYGDADVLRPAEVPEPVPGVRQILLAVKAAAVNPADYKWRSGMFAGMVPLQMPHILGYDVAGAVIAVGERVEEFAVGDRVAAMLDPITKGGYAERVAVQALSAAKIPSELDFARAAALPCAALTGAQLVDEAIKPQAGEFVLVTGAIGAVGLVAMLTAQRRGARVIAAVRPQHIAAARAHGAEFAIVLGSEEWQGPPFNHVIDTVGGSEVAKLCRHLKRGGRLVTAATTPIDGADLPVTPQFIAVRPDGTRLAALLTDVAAGRIPITIARQMPLDQAAAAHRLVEAGGLGGKVILEP